ncbi:hypothetical protein [Cerasicoccus fimbriatus]|uniref:hypothetical protein n=1 Tax=Cerasicoccus fimbriatus TaxID=3014554 RepID=UPI0022B58EE2|nr:hypothetical protein [Cerasicoccus sp. TK19100]
MPDTSIYPLVGWLCLLAAPVFSHAESGASETAQLPAMIATQNDHAYPMTELIPMISGYQVVPWSGQQLAALRSAAEGVLRHSQANPIQSGRVNEVGNQVEDLLGERLVAEGFTVDTPRTQSGRRQSAGYPDLVARKDGETFYIEVKCYSAKTENSTQRSFYLSPSEDPKIREDAIHLLFGFEMKEIAENQYQLDQFHVLDLAELACQVKIEFNASNRDLYGGELTIFQSAE